MRNQNAQPAMTAVLFIIYVTLLERNQPPRCLCFRPPLAGFSCGHEVLSVPHPICDGCGHRRTHARCPVNLDEVVCEVAKRNGCDVALASAVRCGSLTRQGTHPALRSKSKRTAL